jgi:restriction endonuclease S subunit
MANKTFEQLNIEVLGGQIMSRVIATNPQDSVGSWKVIVPRANDSDGLINVDELSLENFKVIPEPRRLTQVGDIVIKLTLPFDSALVTEETSGCFIPSFCAVIRNCGDIDKEFLLAFLASKTCKNQLKAKVTGAITSILSVGKIREIEIPDVSDKIQKIIGKDFSRALKKKQLFKKIAELESKKNDVIFQELTYGK